MPFTVDELAAIRPWAYHVCGEINFESIRDSRSLKSARTLLSGTAHERLLHGRRSHSTVVLIDGHRVEIRDHRPLALGSLALPNGYTIDEFMDELNSRVFFWAGTSNCPVRSGRNHIARYAAEGSVYLLRMPLTLLIKENPQAKLEVTFCNSGSARHNQGHRAYRGPDTYLSPSVACRSPTEVVELTFRGEATLPIEAEYSERLEGPWSPLRHPKA